MTEAYSVHNSGRSDTDSLYVTAWTLMWVNVEVPIHRPSGMTMDTCAL
jgi:hypothetical protein